jgi:hypothetical protein
MTRKGVAQRAAAEADAAKAEPIAVELRRPRQAAQPEFPEDTRLDPSELLSAHRERYPDTKVRQEILTGEPALMLASAARHARCLVVGSRGMLLGRTGRALVHRTDSPPLVVPTPHSD